MTKSKPPRFDIPTLRSVAGEKVYTRGVAYNEAGQVEIISIDRSRVLARVAGSEVYRSELKGLGKKFSGACSCPAFSDWGFCKHLVATALAANALGPVATEQAANRFLKIRDHLRAKGVESLVEMIIGLAERDSALLADLQLAAAETTADDQALFAQFKKAVTEATRTHGFIEYREARGWTQGVNRVLDRVANLIGAGRPKLVLCLLDYFFEQMDEALNSMDDSNGHGGGVYANACGIHLAAVRAAQSEPIALARDLFARETTSDWDFFHGASETYADVLGDAGLAEYRRLANEAWLNIKPPRAGGRQQHDDQFSARYRLKAILESFAERDGDVEAHIAIRAMDLSTAYDYLQIAQLCLDHKREADALKWAEEGLWQFEDRPDERLVLFLADLYRRIGRKKDSDKLLWEAFERRPSMELYRKLKRVAGSAEATVQSVGACAIALLREQLEKSAAKAVWSSPRGLLVEVLVAEKRLDEAWEIVRAHGCGEEQLMDLAKLSECSHPDAALSAYAQSVERLVRLGGQTNYQQASKTITRMQLIRERLGANKEHAVFLAEFMSRHKAKRNMMKLLQTKHAS